MKSINPSFADRPSASRKSRAPLQCGDVVQVKSAPEILATLDRHGTLDGLPFMPEMWNCCGRRFWVLKLALQICTDKTKVPVGESLVRKFKNDDVVILGGLCCSGTDHGGCQRSCALFWKETWLQRVSDAAPSVPQENHDQTASFPVQSPEGGYLCQSGTIMESTEFLSRVQRPAVCCRAVACGNCGLITMVGMLASWCRWKFQQRVFGRYPRGKNRRTPSLSEGFVPGDVVRVRPLSEIRKTLDMKGRNRGMRFTPDMCRYCGKQYTVRSRVGKIVVEGYGSLRKLKSTVTLEGVTSDNACATFGGEPRNDYHYWREIWLQRV